MASTLETTRKRVHPHCVLCRPGGPGDFSVDFSPSPEGGVEAVFFAPDSLQGYPGILHGGVIAFLLDGAMTNCLFSRGLVAVTGELLLRYRHPVALQMQAVVRAWIERSNPPLHLLRAEFAQEGLVRVQARGKFMEHGPSAGSR